MAKLRLLSLLLPFTLTLATASGVAMADTPGSHPAYLHALSDLREARFNLHHRKGDENAKWDESRAIGDIDAAIHKIKEAAIDDGKNVDDHPNPDNGGDYNGRMHKALDALRAARADLDKEEDNDFAKHLKHRAQADIDAAIHKTEQAIHQLRY